MFKNIIYVLLISTLITITTCDTDFVRSNPYDSSYDNSLWMPENLVIEEQNIHTVQLNWIQNEDNIDGFKIDKKRGSEEWIIGYATLDNSVTSYTDSELIPQQRTQYRLYAYADQNESKFVPSETTLNFPPPTNFQVASQTLTSIELTWEESIEGEEGFVIGKKVGNQDVQLNYAIVGENVTSFTDTEITPGVPVSYILFAFYNTYHSDHVSIMTNINLNAPENLSVTQLFDDEVKLTWDDNNTGEDGFIVEVKLDDGDFSETGRVESNSTEITVPNIKKNIQYTFRVAAFVGEFLSEYSNEDSIYIEEIIEGPLVYYPFNGNANDEGHNDGIDGIVNGAILDDDRFNNSEGSYKFDGEDDYIDLGELNSEQLSISIWFRPDQYKNNRPCIISKFSSNNQDGGFLIDLSEVNNHVRFFLKNDGQTINIESTSSIYQNLWHHVAVTFNGSELIIFLDGEMEDVKATTFDKINNLSQNIYLGKSGSDDYHFNGNIDDVRIFNYALNNNEVKDLFYENGWEGNNPQEEEMVFVEGGNFDMGDIWGDGYSNENPVHEVTVNGFYLNKYEVSIEKFLVFMNDIEISEDGNFNDNTLIQINSNTPIQHNGSQFIFVNTGGTSSIQCPVIYCTWYGVAEYCNWMSEKNGYPKVYTISQGSVVCNWNAKGYRMPTEAEWEYAARSRGDDFNKWSGTDSEADAKYYMWFTDNSGNFTHPIGTRKGNSLGIFDLSGNVWEWCWDWYGGYTSEPQINPTGLLNGAARTVRGGSFSNKSYACRSISRGTGIPGEGSENIGFRICRNE